MQSSSLGVFKARLDKALEKTALTPQMTLLGAGGRATKPWGLFSPGLPYNPIDPSHGDVGWKGSPAHRHHPSPEGCPQKPRESGIPLSWASDCHISAAAARWQCSATTHLDVPWPVTKKSEDKGGQHGIRLTPSREASCHWHDPGHGQLTLCLCPCPSPCAAVLAPLIPQRPAAPRSSPAEMVSAGHWSPCVMAGMTAPMALMS